MDLPAIISALSSDKGFLTLVYKDLAQPGVTQVGKALGTIIGLGNTILLPLRLMNEYTRKFEEKNFEEIAARFSKIPEEETVEVPPEIGVPIMESLSYTKDATLREMYIELLAKSATASQCGRAHPSFSNIIASLSPDEAVLIKNFQNRDTFPYVVIELKLPSGKGQSVIHDIQIIPPEGVKFPDNIPLYISNFAGLGIIELRRDGHLTASGVYDPIIKFLESKYRLPATVNVGGQNRSVNYAKQYGKILPFGKMFMTACFS
ncbi:MAG: DUF4393 domain-containing protein [Parasphingopyxis sp.]